MGEVTAFPARVPAPITAFMLAFIGLVPTQVAATPMPAWFLPAGHVGVNFDVGVGVIFGGGGGGGGGGAGGGGGGGGGGGAFFFIARHLVVAPSVGGGARLEVLGAEGEIADS